MSLQGTNSTTVKRAFDRTLRYFGQSRAWSPGLFAFFVAVTAVLSFLTDALRLDSLDPLWILASATTRQLRTGTNPALWRGHLQTILPAPNKLKKVNHHKALLYRQVPSLISNLAEMATVGSLALEFTILNASRTGEVVGGLRSEVHGDIWIIGKCLSNMAMPMALRRAGVDATVHGFRSSFRDWVSEETNHPSEVAEMALAHTISNKVEAAYRRRDLLEKRRLLMNDWQNYCLSGEHS